MKRVKPLAMATVLAVPIISACGDDAVPPTLTGSIGGQVTIEGQGINGVTVTLSSGVAATTAGGGAYRFEDIEEGDYTITISNYPARASFDATSAAATLAHDDEFITVNFTGSWIGTSAITGTVAMENHRLNGISSTATVAVGAVSPDD